MKKNNSLIYKILVCLLFSCYLFSCNKINKDGSVRLNPEEIHIVVWESLGGPDDFIKQATGANKEEIQKIRNEVEKQKKKKCSKNS